MAIKFELRSTSIFSKKSRFGNKLSSFNERIKSSKTKQKNELYLFIDQSYFDNDRAQLFIIIQPIHTTITNFSGLLDTVSQ